MKKHINFASGETIEITKKSLKSKGSFTISDLEKSINLFRRKGSEEELNNYISEITGKKGKLKPKNKKPEINILNINPVKKSLKNILENYHSARKWLNERLFVKRTLSFFLTFLALFLILNTPMYYQRFTWLFGRDKKQIVKTYSIEQEAMAKSAPLDPGEIIPSGSTLIVPKINANAPIVFASSPKESDIQENLKTGVVRYPNTANPGEEGNIFITGHSSNYWWVKGNYNYVFVLLDKMEAGDQAKIYHGGNKYIYQVVEKSIVEPTDVSSMKQTKEPTLTLMTCYPPGTANKRLIVKLKQISPQYFAPRVVEKEDLISVPKTLPTSDNSTFLEGFKSFFKIIVSPLESKD